MDDREIWVRFAAAALEGEIAAAGSGEKSERLADWAALDADALLAECRKRYAKGTPQGDKPKACATCGGTGEATYRHRPGTCFEAAWTESCPDCAGESGGGR